jgi:Rrf2 family iron-sulfur cluster assembly transcriptional regulator
MRLSAKARYAVTAMLDLALHAREQPVTLASIAQCQGISLSYLEQLFSRLRRAGLVDSVRGPGGGYRLARSPSEVTLADVVRAVDEDLDASHCGGRRNCHAGGQCLTHDLWDDLSGRIHGFLGGISLADFISRPQVASIVARMPARV